MKYDWRNETMLGFVKSYFFRYDNFIKGKDNKFIMRSVFGNKHPKEIQIELDEWFVTCIGTYSNINRHKPKNKL
jgi:hypothetical protein